MKHFKATCADTGLTLLECAPDADTGNVQFATTIPIKSTIAGAMLTPEKALELHDFLGRILNSNADLTIVQTHPQADKQLYKGTRHLGTFEQMHDSDLWSFHARKQQDLDGDTFTFVGLTLNELNEGEQ